MATSKLQRKTRRVLERENVDYKFQENVRPQWMEGLELDFYIPDLHLAIEVQGRQHYDFVPFFHNDYDGFLAQRERDKHKKELCARNGVILIEIYDESDIMPFIQEHIPREQRMFEDEWFYWCAKYVEHRLKSFRKEKKMLRQLKKKAYQTKHKRSGRETRRLYTWACTRTNEIKKEMAEEYRQAIVDFRKINGRPILEKHND